jgi:hypothetical protein
VHGKSRGELKNTGVPLIAARFMLPANDMLPFVLVLIRAA